MSLVDELRELFARSDAPLRRRLADQLAELRRREAATAWAMAALPFTVEALKRAAAAGSTRVELSGRAVPRCLRRIPAGGLSELLALLRAQGLRGDPSGRGFVLSWDD